MKCFHEMPVEIIQSITSSLPSSAFAALSISNRKLRWIIGTQYMQRLRRDDEERRSFLELLNRNILESFICRRCQTLHILTESEGWSAILTAAQRFQRMSSLPCLGKYGSWRYPGVTKGNVWEDYDEPPTTHVRMAMKLYQHGSTDLANSYFAYTWLITKRKLMTFLSTHPGFVLCEPRIIHDKMYVRRQYWIMISEIPGIKTSTFPIRQCTMMCRYLNANRKEEGNDFTSALKCRFAHLDDKKEESCKHCDGLVCCPYCLTEVVVEIKTHEKPGKAIVITKWQDLGSISDADEYSRKSDWTCRGEGEPLQKRVPGEIRAVFERQPGVTYDAMLDANKAWGFMSKLDTNEVRWMRHVLPVLRFWNQHYDFDPLGSWNDPYADQAFAYVRYPIYARSAYPPVYHGEDACGATLDFSASGFQRHIPSPFLLLSLLEAGDVDNACYIDHSGQIQAFVILARYRPFPTPRYASGRVGSPNLALPASKP